MIWETGNKSLREIGELFGGLDYAAVAQRIPSNTIQSRFDCRQKVEDLNVKYLDLTLVWTPETLSVATKSLDIFDVLRVKGVCTPKRKQSESAR